MDRNESCERQRSWRRAWRATLASGLLGLTLAGCISPTETDPNTVPVASASQLFVGAQPTMWFWYEADMSRFTAVWTQQMDGTDRQWSDFAEYRITEQDVDDPWLFAYLGGGIVDLKLALAQTEAEGDRVFTGILKMHLAMLGGMTAMAYGDVPFREAGVEGIVTPVYDDQIQVYNDVIAMLGEAVADLGSGQGPGPGSADLVFGGNAASWIPVAHSLQARFHMHLAELEGATRYQQALAEAQQGISSALGNWTAIHTTVSTESNIWSQFNTERTANISAGDFLVETLKERDDPRLAIYYLPGVNCPGGEEFCGSPPGDEAVPGTGASQMNVPGTPAFNAPIVTCTETQSIIAEAAFQLGDEATARTALAAAIACQEAFWGIDLADPAAGLSGQALFDELMLQKYIGLYLNPEVWQDYKRACTPTALQTFEGKVLTARFLYTEDERQANPNNPGNPVSGRNKNDPQGC
jgi:hypothetical protein